MGRITSTFGEFSIGPDSSSVEFQRFILYFYAQYSIYEKMNPIGSEWIEKKAC